MFFESNQQHVHPENGYALHHREISREQMQRFESYMAEIFESFGLDAQTSGTVETPQRFLQALFEATDGYEGDPKLLTVFDAPGRGEADGRFSQVIEGPIPFFALCEHHAFPFYGVAYIGYIPDQQIIGISKLTRLVRLFARRFTVQERLAQQVAAAFTDMLVPHGVAVSLEAHHLCKEMRGVRETASVTRTTVWRGDYEDDSSLRVEFLLASGDHER